MEQLFTVWGETLDKEHVLGLCIYTGICMPERI